MFKVISKPMLSMLRSAPMLNRGARRHLNEEMGMIRSIVRFAGLASLGVAVAACGRDKEIAEKDVKVAEQTVTAVQEDGSTLVPDRMKAVNAVIEKAKDQLIAGDYRAAMKAAEESMAEAQALPAAIAAKKTELTTTFKALAEAVPPMLAVVKARLD